MNKAIYKLVSAIVLFALTFGSFYNVGASSQLAVTTYYVATTGNDANAGTSAAPFKTIQKCANIAGSGAVCSVAAGTYAQRVNVTRAGIAFQGNGKVTMQGFQISADNVKVRGFYMTGMASTLVGLAVSAKTCVIENNHVYYAPRGGISLSSSSSGCIVKNNKLEKNSQWGISADGTNHTVDGNEIWGTIQYHPQWTNPPSWVDADGIRFFGTGHVFRNNYIHDIKFDATYNKTPHIDCFQTWTAATANILFEGNRCHEMYVRAVGTGNSKAQGFMIEGGAHDITIRNNLINAYRAINLGSSSDTTATRNIIILNNTFVGAIPAQLGLEQYAVFVTKATAVTVKNNIFYNILGPAIVGTVSASYNLFYRGDGKSLSGSKGTGDLWNVNPLLTSDYRLTSASPARAKAQGGGDLGAYPYGGTAPSVAAATSTAQSGSETVYDEKDSRFVYSADWTSYSYAGSYGGSYKMTFKNNSFATLTFSGESFSIIYKAGLSFRKFNVFIDGVQVATLNENASSTIFKKRWDYPGQLTSGSHTLKLVFVTEITTSVTAGSLDAVIVRSTTSSTANIAAPLSASSATALPTSTISVQASPTLAAQPVLASSTSTAPIVAASPTSTAAVEIPATATSVPASPIATSVPVSATAIASSIPPTAVVQNNNVPASETLYDDKHGSFAYSADWRDVVLAQASGGSFKKTNEDGSTVTFTFTGQSLSILYTSGPKFGKMNVYMDGVLVGTINENGSNAVYQKRWNYPTELSLGKHTLKLVSVGNEDMNGSIDAVIVR